MHSSLNYFFLPYGRIFVFFLFIVIEEIRVEGQSSEFLLKEGPLVGKSWDCAEVDDCTNTLVPLKSTEKICGTNGKTYVSVCHFMRAHCKEDGVNFNKFGECTASEKCLGQRQAALKEAERKSGVFIPGCLMDGTFEPVQCHSGTGYCWCSTATGQAVRNTVTQNSIPECENFTKRIPINGSIQHMSRQSKGTLESGMVPILQVNNPIQISTHDGAGTIIVKTDFVQIKMGTNEKGTKKAKLMRDCRGQKRILFNKNVLKSMTDEFLREKPPNYGSGLPLEKASLRWKFKTLNVDKDLKGLKRAEYRGMQKIIRRSYKPRKCAKKFPKFCDWNSDKVISIFEWLKCFTLDDYENDALKHKQRNVSKDLSALEINKVLGNKIRPCEYEKDQVLETGNPNAYVPECDSDGFFKSVQCYGSNSTMSWYCFCVNVESGVMIENTSVKYGIPNCSTLWPKCPPPGREERFLKALSKYFLEFSNEKIFSLSKNTSAIHEKNVIEKIFNYVDRNMNKVIEGKEKRRLKKIIKKKKNRFVWICGRKIHKVCDIDGDGKITNVELVYCVSPFAERTRSENSQHMKNEFKAKKGMKNPFIELIQSE